jgi:hypothetical protein
VGWGVVRGVLCDGFGIGGGVGGVLVEIVIIGDVMG